MINIPLKVNGSLLFQDEIVKIASGSSNSIQVTFTIPQTSDFNDPTLTKKAIFRYYQGSYFVSEVNANNEVIVPKFVIASPYFKVALRAENNDKTVVITTNEVQIPVDASPTLYDSTIVDGDVTIRNADNTLHIYEVGDVTYIDFAQAYKTAVDGVINGNYATTSRVALIENSVAGIQSTLINVDSRIIALETAVGNISTDIGGLDERLDAVEENKQDVLVSGENIKTLNGTSLLGEGNYAFDTAFDEESTNAVENQVISKTIREINYELAVIRESLFETILIELPYKVDYAFEYDVPATLSDDDGTHRVVFSETQLDEIEGNGVVMNQLDRHLNFNNNGSQYYSCSVDTKTGLYNLEFTQSSNPTIVSYTDTIFDNNVSANNKILVYFNVVENTLNGADTINGQLWVYSNDGYSISYQSLAEGQHANIISISANQGSSHITPIFRPLGNGAIPQQEIGGKIRFYLKVCNLTKFFGSGNEPTTTSDPRIQWLISYLESHPDYNAGSILNTKVSGLSCGESTISFPQVDLKGALNAHDVLKVVEGDIVEGEQLYNLVKTTNIGSVDLGTLNFSYNTSGANPRFISNIATMKTGSSRNIVCSKYITISWDTILSNAQIDKVIGKDEYGSTYIGIVDKSYIDPATFKQSVQGVPLYFELAATTQTTIATNLTFEQVTLLIQENAKIHTYYLDVPPNVQTKFVVKKAIGE